MDIFFVFVLVIVAGLLIRHFSKKNNSPKISLEIEIEESNDEESNDNDYEPIRYESLDDWEADLTTLWEGSPIEIEFTYQSRKEKTRRKVSLEKVARNSRNELYLIGFCHERNENRTFNLGNVTTMILHNSKRYNHYDFISEVVGIDANGYAFSN